MKGDVTWQCPRCGHAIEEPPIVVATQHPCRLGRDRKPLPAGRVDVVELTKVVEG